MCQVSRTIPSVLKNVKFQPSRNSTKFDGSYISRDDSNGEVCFIIRDLEKFRILIEITILSFFRKLEFSKVLQEQTSFNICSVYECCNKLLWIIVL